MSSLYRLEQKNVKSLSFFFCFLTKTDARVKKHLQRAQEKLDQELQKEKAMYRGMFSSKLKSDCGQAMNQSGGTGEEL